MSYLLKKEEFWPITRKKNHIEKSFNDQGRNLNLPEHYNPNFSVVKVVIQPCTRLAVRGEFQCGAITRYPFMSIVLFTNFVHNFF